MQPTSKPFLGKPPKKVEYPNNFSHPDWIPAIWNHHEGWIRKDEISNPVQTRSGLRIAWMTNEWLVHELNCDIRVIIGTTNGEASKPGDILSVPFEEIQVTIG